MSYANTLFHLTFDELPLTDPVGSTVITGGDPELVDGIFGNALSLPGTNIYRDAVTVSQKMSFSFWLKSTNPGVAQNPSTNEATALHMAVMFQGVMSYSSGVFSDSTPSFIFYEKTQSDGTNKLFIVFSGLNIALSPVTYTLESSAYDVGKFHHFFVNYNGEANTVTLYINLEEDINAVTTGSVPATLNTSSYLTINKDAPGSGYQVIENQGILDDLAIFNKNFALADIRRMCNMGVLYVADTSYSDIEEVYHGILFDDPNTVQSNSVFANRGNIYVGRSDGVVLRGTRSIWESRREFSNIREIENLTIIKKTDDTVSIEDGLLKVKNEIIRI